MSIVVRIGLGLLAGFTANRLVNNSGEGLLLDILLGVVGSMVGGSLFYLVGATGVTGLNIWSLLVSVIGAVVVLLCFHAFKSASWFEVRPRRTDQDRP
jgi:uncharacterized membrane protein YeaQ/YmgE (transglycosylase-associated protein family)